MPIDTAKGIHFFPIDNIRMMDNRRTALLTAVWSGEGLLGVVAVNHILLPCWTTNIKFLLLRRDHHEQYDQVVQERVLPERSFAATLQTGTTPS